MLRLLKNLLAMPILFYILRKSSCADNPILDKFDLVLNTGLENILNVQLSNDQWKQALLPVHTGGLGVRSTRKLAPAASLTSAAATHPLQEAILSASPTEVKDTAVNNIKSA